MSVSDVRQELKLSSGSRSICFHWPLPYFFMPMTRKASSSLNLTSFFKVSFLGHYTTLYLAVHLIHFETGQHIAVQDRHQT